MRKLNKCVFTLLIVTGLMLTSCSNNDESTAGESTGDYWPTAVGNQWKLDQNGKESVMKITSSEKIKGDTYFSFDQFSLAQEGGYGSAITSIKKVKGDYYIKVDDIVYNTTGITGKTSGYEFIFFKDYLDVNETWKGSYTQETSFDFPGAPVIKLNINYTGTILEKDATANINKITFKNVIKFKLVLEAKMEGEKPSSVSVEYWIAKDVGIVKMVSGGSVAELISYSLK